MEFSVEIPSNQQAIQLVDEMMKSYVTTYNLPNQRELCFVLHELVINAIEAMERLEQINTLQVHVVQDGDHLQMCVIDEADGIPEDKWQEALTYDVDAMIDSDRGRGLFFVQHMVDQIWFEFVAPQKFLVGVSKKLVVEE